MIVAVKTIMATTFGVVLGAAGMTVGFGGAVLGGLDLGDTSTMAATTLWALLFTALSAVLGLGVGMILRHSSGAISGLLMPCDRAVLPRARLVPFCWPLARLNLVKGGPNGARIRFRWASAASLRQRWSPHPTGAGGSFRPPGRARPGQRGR